MGFDFSYLHPNVGKLKLRTMVLALIALTHVALLNAQDIHFSQYLSSPFNLNPALTGDFKGDYRLIGNYRNQWKSITTPYKTFGVSGDMTNLAKAQNLSAGLSIYSDEAGDSYLNTLIIQLPFSYGYPLTSDSAHSIYFGVMPGMVRQQFDYSNLNFDNQYDNQLGLHDPSIASGENTDNTSITYINFSAGFRYHFSIAPRHNIDGGFSIFNLVNSNKYYLSTEKSEQKRYNLHLNYQINLSQKLDLLPGLLYSEQGQNKNMVFGSSARYIYNGLTAFHLGAWYRNKDAGFVSVGLTYQSLYMGFSYDVNSSKLKEASDGKGAYELSIIYIVRKFKPNRGKYLSCPNYL